MNVGGTIVATAEVIAAIADAVVERLREDGSHQQAMLTVDEVAARYSLSTETVYRRAAELGGVKIGDGPKAAWRFDPAVLAERLAPRPDPRARPNAPAAHRQRRRSATAAPAELLPIRGRS